MPTKPSKALGNSFEFCGKPWTPLDQDSCANRMGWQKPSDGPGSGYSSYRFDKLTLSFPPFHLPLFLNALKSARNWIGKKYFDNQRGASPFESLQLRAWSCREFEFLGIPRKGGPLPMIRKELLAPFEAGTTRCCSVSTFREAIHKLRVRPECPHTLCR